MEIIKDVLAVIGGVGVILLILFEFLGHIWRDRLKERERRITERELQNINHRRIQADEFLSSQYEVYIELWKSLQSLKLLVDTLWDRATMDNIVLVANQLRVTKTKVNNWSIFFSSDHLRQLNKLFTSLEQLEAGKTRLVEIRTRQDVAEYMVSDIEYQINKNRQYRDQFMDLLETLRTSFQEKLSII